MCSWIVKGIQQTAPLVRGNKKVIDIDNDTDINRSSDKKINNGKKHQPAQPGLFQRQGGCIIECNSLGNNAE
jgi:hypothetical protein